MESCIFCNIAKGDVPSYKIYEDESTFAFLDRHPINPGHVLVIPKKHEPDFYNLDDATYQTLMSTVKRISKLVYAKINPKRVGLIVAGWDVPHTHVHVVPMQHAHDIASKSTIEGNQTNPTEAELANTAKILVE